MVMYVQFRCYKQKTNTDQYTFMQNVLAQLDFSRPITAELCAWGRANTHLLRRGDEESLMFAARLSQMQYKDWC